MSVSARLRRTPFVALAVAAVIAALLRLGSASDASTPTEGSVSDANPVATWAGGPFVAPNATAQASGTPVCSVPQSCDDFTLHVDTPAAYDTDHDLKIDVSWPDATADFDTYVLDSAGNLVGSAASSADPEEVVLPPVAGDYTVRVVPFAPIGQSYAAKAQLVTKAADPAPGTDTPAGFTNYTAPSSFTDANNAGEPSIGTNWKSGATLYQAYLSTYKVTFDDSTTPAKATWSDVSANAAKGCPQGSVESLDPILFTDHTTGRTLESQLTGQDSLTCTTDDDGATWLPSQGGGIPSGVDHQSIGGGPYSANGVGALPVSGYPNAVYYCSQDIATAFCATSRDGGTTFGPGVPTYSLLDCGGIHGHVKVGPDGTVYLPNRGCGNTAAVVTSTDNGATWTVDKVPGTSTSDADPSVGVGSDGTVYFGYVGSDGRPGVAVSHDHGTTWSTPQPVGTEFGIQNAVFPAVVAGDGDRAAIAFIGTPTDGNYQDAATFKGVWHLYVATTYDGGQTWQTSDATPNDPVQRGSICTGGTTCGADRNLLDFIDTTIDSHGRVEVAYADGCIKTCVTDASQSAAAGPADAQAAYATIARQSSGKPLFAKYDAQPDLTPTSVTATRQGSSDSARVVVAEKNGSPVSAFTTQLLDNGQPVGAETSSVTANGTTTLTFTWKATGGAHTVTAVVDPQNQVAESDETDNRASATVGK